jgi:hypothetical protein
MTIKKTALHFGLAMLATGLLQTHHTTAQNAWAYKMDKTNHVITIYPTGNYTKDARNALAFLAERPDKDTYWTLLFAPGKYYLTLPLYCANLTKVNFFSNPSNPARIIKAANFSGSEYLLYLRTSQDIKVRGFEWYGKTTFQNGPNPVWPDQGIYFGSCRNILIDNNKFFNFGDAALRTTTSEADPVKGVNSLNTIVTNNYFNNIYQVSTTSNDKVHGGTRGYRMEKNTFVNLRGSVKFATRTPGASDVHIVDNVINGGDHFGLEIDNYNNMEIRGNNFENIKGVAINMYTNGDRSNITKGFQWGNNFTIAGNVVKNCGRAIRFCPSPFFDGTVVTPKKVIIDSNTLSNITDSNRDTPAIAVIDGKVDGLQITKNKMYSIKSSKYIAIQPGCTNIVQSSNLVNNTLLSTGGGLNIVLNEKTPPARPTNLSGKYQGGQKVMLSWTDNAASETSEEIWASLDGKKYDFVARLKPASTKFSHQLSRLPAKRALYYTVKSVNKVGSSAPSPAYLVRF